VRISERRSFLKGYARGRREHKEVRLKLERELAASRAAITELRSALSDWRTSTEARRAAETALVDFWRNVYTQQQTGASLH
jgi:hypothetical protein